MSDPVTNIEIEDVLSSIRRLVSEDTRVAKKQAPPEEVPDRLVLTPALRVPEAGPETAPEQDSAASYMPGTLAGYSDEPVVPEAFEWVPEVGTAADQVANLTAQAEHNGAHAADDLTDDDGTDLPAWANPEATLLGAVNSQEDRAALLSGIIAPEDDPAQIGPLTERSETPEPKDTFGVRDVAEQLRDDMDTVPEVADLPPLEPEEIGDLSPRPEPAAPSLGERIAAVETVVAQTQEDWDPDLPGEHGNAGSPVTVLRWKDAEPRVDVDPAPAEAMEGQANRPQSAEASGAEADAAEPSPDEEKIAYLDPSFDDWSDEELDADIAPAQDLVLDEAALRALVSELVREELQGVLGERITRNVRKLVRREIQRALTAQDFE